MADNRETGRQFDVSEIERICEIAFKSNVPASFDSATDSAFRGAMSAISKDKSLFLKIWREMAYRIFEREFHSEDEAHYALLYGRTMAFGQQLFARRVGTRFSRHVDPEELERKLPEESVLSQNLEATLKELDMLHEGVISRSTLLRWTPDGFKDPSPFFLGKTTQIVEEYFSDPQKQARIRLLAFSA